MNTVTARVMPSTAMRVTMAGTESDRVRCAGACVEVMGDSAFRGAGGVPESAGGGRAGATRRPGRSGGGGGGWLRWRSEERRVGRGGRGGRGRAGAEGD